MSEPEILQTHVSHGGRLHFCRHESEVCGGPMRFAVYLPPAATLGPVPAVWWLSGLTCTDENFMVKAGAQRYAARLGLALVAPDTSPRDTGTPGEDDDWDLGTGAGFYVDATAEPWSAHYRMESWLTAELPAVVADRFPVDLGRQSVAGHSMGGHGALTLALRHPGRFRAVSAFSPICSPTRCPWGEKALGAYLGPDRSAWAGHDASLLVADAPPGLELLVDQGLADEFLNVQLKPALLVAACAGAGVSLDLRERAGYDHSYYYIASFIGEHLDWHAERLV
jgi:S-formylglutathione hydrolase